jgi:hypothetical protein
VAAPDLVGQAQQAHVHRRHQIGVGQAVPLDQAQRRLGVEARLEHDQRVGLLRRRDHVAVRRAVVQRRTDERAHARLGADHAAHLLLRGRDLRGGGRLAADALGPPGRAGGVEHRPACRPRRLGERRRRVAQRRPGREASQRRGREHRDARGRHGAEFVQQVGLGDEELRAAVGQDVAQLVGLEVPVDRAPGGAEPTRREHQLERERAVAQHQRDDVALADPVPLQRRGRAQRALEEVLGVLAAVLEHDGRFHRGSSLQPARRRAAIMHPPARRCAAARASRPRRRPPH